MHTDKSLFLTAFLFMVLTAEPRFHYVKNIHGVV